MATAFRIEMDNDQENPPTTSAASGLGTVVFDSTAVTASYNITVSGLDFGEVLGIADQTPDPNDDVHGIHVHNAARGVNGGIVFGQLGPAQDDDDFETVLNPDGSTTLSGIWETTDPANSSIANFSAALGAAALGSDFPLYWNIHTEQFPGGAIRGQWVCIATDNSETVSGTDGDDILPGLGGDDTVNGGLGDDTLDGGSGADALLGGTGDDIYVVDNAGDVVTENGNEGTDTVQSSITYKLGGSVNNLTLTGTAHINGTGTGSKNTLIGNSGINKLDGGGGADSMAGGAGDDTYVVDDGGDVLSENPAEGRDTVEASITFDLAGKFNNLTLTGTADIDGTGTGSDNRLKGNTGRNTLDGEGGEDLIKGNAGNDTLTGGGDDDILVFGDDDGNDVVTDFEDGSDRIDLTTVDAVDNFGDIDVTDTGPGVLVDYGTGTIQLDNVARATSITASDFIFA